jgi:hypothetical protein
MTDILEALRDPGDLDRDALLDDAADAIEQLRAELAFSRQINAMLRRLGDRIDLGPEED